VAARVARSGLELLLTWAWPVVLALAVLLPLLLSRGYTLRGDMVFVPDQPWKPAWLGLDGGVPRAVPSDALTWLAGTALPGDLVQKAVLVLTLVLAGVGMARLVREVVGVGDGLGPGRAWLMTAAPVALYVWNPFVYERLSIGHWALLCGYAALPWVVVAARGAHPLSVAVPAAVAAWTSPTGGLLAGVTAVAVLATGPGPRVRRTGVGGLAVAAVNLPWVVPGLLAPATTAGDQGQGMAGVGAFAARADTPWGVLGSLASFGGLWKEAVDPPGRDAWLLSGVSLALAVLGVVGLVLLARRRAGGLAWTLGALGAGGLLLAWLPTTGTGQDLMDAIGAVLPGGGLLRDSQKWLAPLVLASCTGFAEVVRRCLDRDGRTESSGALVAAALAVLPLAALPGLAWGLAGTLGSVPYPEEWHEVRGDLERAGASDDRMVVLPFTVYRRYPWNEQTAVLDPAPRFFPGDVVVDDALPVRGGVVPGESRLADRIRAAADPPEGLAEVLAAEDVRFVLVERSTPGGGDVAVPGGDVLHQGEDLVLVDLGHEGDPRRLGSAGFAAVLVADALAVAVVVVALGTAGRRRLSAGRGVRRDAGRA